MEWMIWTVVPALLMLPLWVCVYVCARRGVGACASGRSCRWIRWVSFGISALVMLPALNVWGKGGLWTLAVLHICAFALITQLVQFLLRTGSHGKPHRVWDRLYQFTVLPILCTALVLGWGAWNMGHVVETDYTVTTEKSIPAEGWRVALVADVHFGTSNDRAAIQQVSDRISAAHVDLLVLCGDIVDENTTFAQMQQVFRIFGGTHTTYGTYFVYGNHDPARYTSTPAFTTTQLAEALTDSGITTLEDQVVSVTRGLTLIGRRDRSRNRATTAELVRKANPADYLILADHQPKEFAEKAAAGVDLQLSGHTHAGQIFPVGWLSILLHTDDWNYGLETVEGMTAVVTSGVSGWGYPIRTQGCSEYVILTIQPAKHGQK